VRHLPARLPQEISVFLIHATIFALAGAAVAALVGAPRGPSKEVVMVMLWCNLVFCSALQAARNSSAVVTYGGSVLAVAVLCAGVLGGNLLRGAELLAEPKETAILIWTFGAPLCVGALARFSTRVEARPTVRRVLISSLLVLGPLPGAMFTMEILAPRGDSQLHVGNMIASIVLCVGGTVLFLRLTEGARRALAYSSR